MLGLIFTYAMTLGGSFVSLFVSPYVGLLVYVSFAILRPGVGCWSWSVPPGNYSKILAICLLVGWAARGFGDWRLGRAWVIILPLIAYVLWNVLSATQALIPDIAWERVESQAKIVLPVVVGLSLIDSVEKLKQLAWVILLSYGYVAYELNMDYFAGFNRLQLMGFGGMDNNCMAIALVSCSGLGMFLCMGASQLWQKAIAAACVGFMIHAILFSFSRGGMLGLILVVGISFLLIPKRPIHFLSLVAGVAIALATTGSEVTARFNSSFAEDEQRDESAQSRLDLWTKCVEKTQENPLLGVGPNHFGVHAEELGFKKGKEAHTTWLQLAVELGVPGVAFLLLYFTLPIVCLWPLTRKSTPLPDPFLRDIARMVIASTIGYVFTAQFVTLPGVEAPYFIVLLGAGALKILAADNLRLSSRVQARDFQHDYQ